MTTPKKSVGITSKAIKHESPLSLFESGTGFFIKDRKLIYHYSEVNETPQIILNGAFYCDVDGTSDKGFKYSLYAFYRRHSDFVKFSQISFIKSH
jgi:hypothetical protein